MGPQQVHVSGTKRLPAGGAGARHWDHVGGRPALGRTRTQSVSGISPLARPCGALERVGGGLLEHFSTPCEHCRGRGVIVSTEPVTESPSGRGGEKEQNGDNGGRRGRGRGKRSENAERPRRLPDWSSAVPPECLLLLSVCSQAK